MKSKIIIVAIIFSIFIGSFTIDTIVDHTRNKSNENKEVSKELADSEMNVIDENENVVIDSNELEQEKQENKKEPITTDDKIKENIINMIDPGSNNTNLWLAYNSENTSQIRYFRAKK